MKKLVGIVAALAMLCSAASAATVTWDGNEPEYNSETGEVVALYTGLEAGQATMLAYDVTDIADATAATAFIDTTETPIMGIDQGTPDGTFSFPVPEDFTGKIVLMVGGTDVATPVSALVVIENGTVEEITVIWGDINGDGIVDATDGTAIINYTYGGSAAGKYTIGANPFGVSSEKLWGDINGDGIVDATDGQAIIDYTYGGANAVNGNTFGANVTVTSK